MRAAPSRARPPWRAHAPGRSASASIKVGTTLAPVIGLPSRTTSTGASRVDDPARRRTVGRASAASVGSEAREVHAGIEGLDVARVPGRSASRIWPRTRSPRSRGCGGSCPACSAIAFDGARRPADAGSPRRSATSPAAAQRVDRVAPGSRRDSRCRRSRRPDCDVFPKPCTRSKGPCALDRAPTEDNRTSQTFERSASEAHRLRESAGSRIPRVHASRRCVGRSSGLRDPASSRRDGHAVRLTLDAADVARPGMGERDAHQASRVGAPSLGAEPSPRRSTTVQVLTVRALPSGSRRCSAGSRPSQRTRRRCTHSRTSVDERRGAETRSDVAADRNRRTGSAGDRSAGAQG